MLFTKSAAYERLLMKKPVALQLYSVRDDISSDFAGTVNKIHKMGYDGVELSDTCGLNAAEIRSILEETELVPISAHVPPFELFNNTQKTIEYYVALGCKYIAFPWMPEEMRTDESVFAETVKKIAAAGKYACDHGITLLYHNHDFEFRTFGGKYLLDTGMFPYTLFSSVTDKPYSLHSSFENNFASSISSLV